MFPQQFVQAQIKENIKAPRHWPLWGEFTVTGHNGHKPKRPQPKRPQTETGCCRRNFCTFVYKRQSDSNASSNGLVTQISSDFHTLEYIFFYIR